MPDGSEPREGWLPAVFLPDADMDRYSVNCSDNTIITDKDDMAEYGLPEDLAAALILNVDGPKEDIMNMFADIAGKFGLDAIVETAVRRYPITPNGTAAADPMDLLRDYP